MKKYLAVTIGPIIEFLDEARSTRELSVASLFFSRWGSHIIKYLDEKLAKANRILPISSPDNKSLPDRYIYSIGNEDIKLECLSESLREDFFNKISSNKNHNYYKNNQIDIAIEEVINFFQIHMVVYESDENKCIENANEILDSMECLKYKTMIDEDKESAANRTLKFILSTMDDKVVDSTTYIGYYSMFNKAPADLYYTKIRGIDEKSIDEAKLRELALELGVDYPKSQLKHCKYVVVVQGDGDNFGRTLKNLFESENIQDKDTYTKILKVVDDYSVEIGAKIKNFGGHPIYIGGDDILCFLPVVGHKGKFFVELLDEINKEFIIKLEKIDGEISKCLGDIAFSFGACVYYYKYPLHMARKEATNLLFSNAKKHEYKLSDATEISKKNSIAIKLVKHSGKNINLLFSLKDRELYPRFIRLCNEYMNLEKAKLTSIIHRLQKDQELLNLVFDKYCETQNDNMLLDYIDKYIANNFNESIHTSFTEFLDNIKEIIIVYIKLRELNREVDNSKENKESSSKKHMLRINDLASLIEFSQFLTERMDESDL